MCMSLFANESFLKALRDVYLQEEIFARAFVEIEIEILRKKKFKNKNQF